MGEGPFTAWHGRAVAGKASQPSSLGQKGFGVENSGPNQNAPCVIRTHDRLLRRQLLYPAELREQGRHCARPHGQGQALPVSILAGPSP